MKNESRNPNHGENVKEKKNVELKVYLQPGAKQTCIAGMYGEHLKIKVNAPPVEGKANEALVHFLADYFDIPKTTIKIISGEKSRLKTVSIFTNIAEEKILKLFLLAHQKDLS